MRAGYNTYLTQEGAGLRENSSAEMSGIYMTPERNRERLRKREFVNTLPLHETDTQKAYFVR